MIISSVYNIAGPEVEEALLSHPAVAECGVVGAPDEERGQIAPYKHPRAVVFVDSLPRTQTNKLQRFVLRQWAAAPGHVKAS